MRRSVEWKLAGLGRKGLHVKHGVLVRSVTYRGWSLVCLIRD